MVDDPLAAFIGSDVRLDDRGSLEAKLAAHSDVADYSDAELLLAAYVRWRRAMLEHISGQYAFVIVDPAKGLAFAARDGVGLRPLFYTTVPDGIAFGSSIEIIAALLPGKTFEINLPRLRDLTEPLPRWRGWASETAFANVMRLPAGSAIEFDASGMRQHVHDELVPDDRGCQSDEDYAAEFRASFDRSIRERTRGRSQPAVIVSGGLDSSAIACRLAEDYRQGGPMPRLYSWVFDSGHTADERRFLESVEKACAPCPVVRLNGHECWGLTSDFPESRFSEPETWWNPLLFERAAVRAVADGADVVFTGAGADEITQGAGYEFPQAFGELNLRAALREYPHFRSRSSAARLALEFGARPLLDWGRMARDRRAWGRVPSEVRGFTARRIWNNVRGGKAVVKHARFNLLEVSAGIRWELPFLDRRIVTLSLAAPFSARVRADRRKHLLREATRGLLPEDVRLRTVPAHFGDLIDWGVSQHAAAFRELLSAGRLGALGLLDEASKRRLVDGLEDLGHVDPIFRPHLLRVAHLEMWLASRPFRDTIGRTGA